MYQVLKRELTTVDVDKANELLKYNTYVTQRKIRQAHVNKLLGKTKDGTFRFGEIALAHRNGNIYMMNGQHVCSAISKTNVPQQCVIEEFQVDNDLDMSLLYKQFEILPRSIKDMVRVEAHALGIIWPDRVSNLIVSAASIIEADHPSFDNSTVTTGQLKAKTGISKEDKVGYLRNYIKEGYFVAEILDSPNVIHIRRAPVVAMIIKTWRMAMNETMTLFNNNKIINKNTDVYLFWVRVRDGENLTRSMPEWHLREFLLNANMIQYRGKTIYRKATNHEIGYRCAVAWNNFRANKEISKISYRPDKNIPKLK